MNQGRLAGDIIDRTIVVCPNCGTQAPVLSAKQLRAFSAGWSFGVAGLVAGVAFLYFESTFEEVGISDLTRTLSVIAFVVGGICLAITIAITVIRKRC